MDPGEEDLAISISNGESSKKKRTHFLGGKSTAESKKENPKMGTAAH